MLREIVVLLWYIVKVKFPDLYLLFFFYWKTNSKVTEIPSSSLQQYKKKTINKFVNLLLKVNLENLIFG